MEDSETKWCIDRATTFYNKQRGTLGPLTKMKAIQVLTVLSNGGLTEPRRGWRDRETRKRSSTIFLAEQLVGMLLKSEETDPIRFVVSFFYKMDDEICKDPVQLPWLNFCNYMKDAAQTLLEYLATAY